MVYPSSNAFNSYHDNDTGSIGGVKDPPPVNNYILYISSILDLLSVIISVFLVSAAFGALVTGYILASRAYSHRKVRIKKLPITGFLWVVFFQGAYTFSSALYGITGSFEYHYLLAALASSLQIAAVYPISQIYQHKEDLNDGVKTISYVLGYSGTFIFSALMFLLATLCYALYFGYNSSEFTLLLLIQAPVITAFVIWFKQVRKDHAKANFLNTMRFNVLAAISFNLYYILLILAF